MGSKLQLQRNRSDSAERKRDNRRPPSSCMSAPRCPSAKHIDSSLESKPRCWNSPVWAFRSRKYPSECSSAPESSNISSTHHRLGELYSCRPDLPGPTDSGSQSEARGGFRHGLFWHTIWRRAYGRLCRNLTSRKATFRHTRRAGVGYSKRNLWPAFEDCVPPPKGAGLWASPWVSAGFFCFCPHNNNKRPVSLRAFEMKALRWLASYLFSLLFLAAYEVPQISLREGNRVDDASIRLSWQFYNVTVLVRLSPGSKSARAACRALGSKTMSPLDVAMAAGCLWLVASMVPRQEMRWAAQPPVSPKLSRSPSKEPRRLSWLFWWPFCRACRPGLMLSSTSITCCRCWCSDPVTSWARWLRL